MDIEMKPDYNEYVAHGPGHEDDSLVCITHLRHIPCRRDDPPCVNSTDPFDVEIIRTYHASLINAERARALIKFHHRGLNTWQWYR